MDISNLKTFLEVYRTRHFGRAADNLYISQSAVSARIRQLEEVLGVSLFTRTRNDIQLTPAGQRLLVHAESILAIWNQACHAIAVQSEAKQPLVIGGTYSLWDVWLGSRINQAFRAMQHVVFHTEACGPETLVRRLGEGSIDVVFMTDPPQSADMELQPVGDLNLVLISSQPDQTASTALTEGYVMVDWGAAFAATHARHFPDCPVPVARLVRGNLAQRFLEVNGGAAYLELESVQEALAAGRLYRVSDAPVIKRPVYAAYRPALAQLSLVQELVRVLGRQGRRKMISAPPERRRVVRKTLAT